MTPNEISPEMEDLIIEVSENKIHDDYPHLRVAFRNGMREVLLNPEKYSLIPYKGEVLSNQDNQEHNKVLELIRMYCTNYHQIETGELSKYLTDYVNKIHSRIKEIGLHLQAIQNEFMFEFRSQQHWVDKAQSWFRPYKGEEYICLDTNGNLLTCGKDFMVAEERNLYPVKVYRLIRTADAVKNV